MMVEWRRLGCWRIGGELAGAAAAPGIDGELQGGRYDEAEREGAELDEEVDGGRVVVAGSGKVEHGSWVFWVVGIW